MTALAASVKPPRLSERDFQRQVTDLAELLGWSWTHFRPAVTSRGWRTPVSGPLGAGFPDLFLARPRDQRVMLRELKANDGKLTPDQKAVVELLRASGVDVDVWRPADIERVVAELR